MTGDLSLIFPDNSTLGGQNPVVVIGPNGSGKTRQTRQLRSPGPIEFVNALRNTRVSPELPIMSYDAAQNNFFNQKQQSRSQHWELASEFDFMMSQMLAQDAMVAKEFTRRFREDPNTAGQPEYTPLTRVEELWKLVFPGRILRWEEWKPVVDNVTSGQVAQYSGNQMSDGEKSALYLAARVFSTDPGILVVDEPETHFHSLLAVRLWNTLEDARPDIRFVYVTHDLTFAMSRRQAHYVIASPTAGLRAIEVDRDLPDDISSALLGSASLSFYASRIVFCEGDQSSLDVQLYEAWFNGADTVVKSVNNCHGVLRCVEALQGAGIARSLDVLGIIDRDYHGEPFIESLKKVHVLPVHEVESLLAWPKVAQAVARHTGADFNEEAYLNEVRRSVSEKQKTALVVERWKARIEPQLTGLVSGATKKASSLEDLGRQIPGMFDMTKWGFSPQGILSEEAVRTSNALASKDAEALFAIIPGKQLLPIAARSTGMANPAYCSLIFKALRDPSGTAMESLRDELVAALTPLLPARAVAVNV
ncbi:ATP-dependent nuclease [Streptomyces sp. NPDC086782]|uniref:ATP-dependent nuclease n=1 Tax=Streptomyces sp. NPDC086782 TaxID=3365757 RepID=UPI0037F92BAA